MGSRVWFGRMPRGGVARTRVKTRKKERTRGHTKCASSHRYMHIQNVHHCIDIRTYKMCIIMLLLLLLSLYMLYNIQSAITGGWMKVSVGPSHWCQANYCCCCCCCCYRCCTGYQSTVSWREARALLHIDARQQEVMGPGSSLKAAPRSGREEMLSSSKGNRIIQPWWQKYLLGGDKLQIRKFKM